VATGIEGSTVGAARGTPLCLQEGVPVYLAGQAPEGLLSQTQLGAFPRRLKLGPGQLPLAWVDTHDWGRVPLYDPAGAVKMRPLPSKIRARMERERTCPACGVLRDYVVRRQCLECERRAQTEAERRERYVCRGCRTARATPYPKGSRRQCRACLAAEGVRRRTCRGCSMVRRTIYPQRSERLCRACLAARALRRREVLAAMLVCAGTDCTTAVATLAEVRRWRREHPHGYWQPRLCPPCTAVEAERREEARRQAAERDRAARQARERERDDLAAWARDALADPRTVILDTETTGLEDTARIVEVSVIDATGKPLVDTLLRPGYELIPRGATAIHGIDDAMVSDAPTFSETLATLTAALKGRRVLIYNRVFDVKRLRHELMLHYLDRAAEAAAERAVTTGRAEIRHEEMTAEALAQATAWFEAMEWEDVMIPYSDWYGDWNDYFGNYSWQPLNGGHRALGDCRAVVERLEEMSNCRGLPPIPSQVPADMKETVETCS